MNKEAIRLFIKRTPLIYAPAKILMDLRGKRKLCGKKTHLCIEGYPSSANSFTYTLCRFLNPSLRIAHHCHSVANIKLGLRHDAFTLVLLRNPVDAISSNIIRFGNRKFNSKTIIRHSIEEYIEFYSFVLEVHEQLFLVIYDDIINDTRTVIDHINESDKIHFYYRNLEEVKENSIEYMKDWATRKNSLDRISLPNSQRAKIKLSLAKDITESPYYESADALYNQLKSCKKY